MSNSPVICFGQQPNGFFPKRFFVAKIHTARRLQKEIGGEIVYFLHDSDHDPRETRTILRHRHGGVPLQLNFTFENKLQKKHSPLYLKRVSKDWQANTALQLRHLVDPQWIEAFKSVEASDVASFCLEMYQKMGLMENIRVIRSSNPALRRAACEVPDFFVDVPYEGEVVRGRYADGTIKLHEGGNLYITLPAPAFTKEQVSPTRDTRFGWMQSVLHCTHYVAGASEQDYLHIEQWPETVFVKRDTIERSDEAYTELP